MEIGKRADKMNTNNDDLTEEREKLFEEIGNCVKNNLNKIVITQELMEFLEIPTGLAGQIKSTDLYDILMDKDKLKVLISKLRNKAFW